MRLRPGLSLLLGFCWSLGLAEEPAPLVGVTAQVIPWAPTRGYSLGGPMPMALKIANGSDAEITVLSDYPHADLLTLEVVGGEGRVPSRPPGANATRSITIKAHTDYNVAVYVNRFCVIRQPGAYAVTWTIATMVVTGGKVVPLRATGRFAAQVATDDEAENTRLWDFALSRIEANKDAQAVRHAVEEICISTSPRVIPYLAKVLETEVGAGSAAAALGGFPGNPEAERSLRAPLLGVKAAPIRAALLQLSAQDVLIDQITQERLIDHDNRAIQSAYLEYLELMLRRVPWPKVKLRAAGPDAVLGQQASQILHDLDDQWKLRPVIQQPAPPPPGPAPRPEPAPPAPDKNPSF